MQEKQVERIYENLIEVGISEENIPTLVLNLVTINRDDTEQILSDIEQGNLNDDTLQRLNGQDAEFMEPVKAEQLEDYLEFYKVEGTDIKLRDYQQNAIDKVDKIFEDRKFASVILPTGAGKSFVAIAELMKMQAEIDKDSDEKVLYLAPSNEILNQIMKYTEKYVHGEKLGKTREQIFKEVFPNVELATYQSLLQKNEDELQNEKYKFMVLDELHRTGAKEWGDRLNTVLEAQDENVRVLGITATPERDVDGRNMADEIALKLGYSEKDIENRKHIAKKMDLIDAIRLGIVVNPKIVECEYNLKNDTERWEALLEKINGMEDGPEKEEYVQKYQTLRRKINEAQEIPELLRDNIVKKDGKYIFYMPIGANEYNEDDEGNSLSKKSGADKVKQAQEQLKEWLKYIDAEPEFYSMLGEYGDKRNAEQLERFENSNSEHIKIMIVMNKLNEGVHVDGINGIIWQRALDENSRILLLQQLGRAIYSTNEGEIINDEDRPIVIDLPNNLTKVDLEKAINTYTEIDDIEMLQNVLDWINIHEGILPDINSGFKEEARMASTLKRIQEKYIKYMDDEQFKKLAEDKVSKVETILEMGNDISLWDVELPEKEKKTGIKVQGEEWKNNFDFSLEGVLKDFVVFEKNICINKSPITELIEVAEILKKNKIDLSKIQQGRRQEGKRVLTLLKEIKQEGINIDKIIEENGLDGKFPFGSRLKILRQAYKGKGGYKITEEEKRKAEELGLILSKEKSALAETLEVAEILKKNGVDLSEIQLEKTKEGKNGSILLKDITQNGINIDKIIEENGLDGKFPFGSRIRGLKSTYSGKDSYTITEENKKKAEELGLIEKKSEIKKTLEIAEILKNNGIDLSSIQQAKREEGKKVSILLKDIKQEGININKIIEENGLDGDFKFGRRITVLRQSYKGKGKCKMTEEDKRKAEELGLIPTVKTQNIGQATYTASVQECDEASGVIKELLSEKEKIADK